MTIRHFKCSNAFVCNCWGNCYRGISFKNECIKWDMKNNKQKYSEFEDSLILKEKQYRCLRRKVRERLPLIQLIVSESCLCFISANTPLLLQHTINYSTFSARMWGGAREKWMTKVAEQGMKCGWSNFRAILLPSAQVECSIMHTSFSFSFLSSHP